MLPTEIFFCDADGSVLHASNDIFTIKKEIKFWKCIGLDFKKIDKFFQKFSENDTHYLENYIFRIKHIETSCHVKYIVYVYRYYSDLFFGNKNIYKLLLNKDSEETIIEELIEKIDLSVCILDNKFNIFYANLKSKNIFGNKFEYGKNILKIFDDKEGFDSYNSSLKNGESWRKIFNIKIKSGRKISMNVYSRVFFFHEDRFFICTFQDMHEIEGLKKKLQKSRSETAGMNIAIKQILRTQDEEKQSLLAGVIRQLHNDLLPTLERIAREDSPKVRQAFSAALEEKMADLGEEPSEILSVSIQQLTERELDICRLIQQGWKGRAIAENLGIAFETLQTHRKNIRKKLQLRGSGMSLSSYLEKQGPL